MEPTFDDGEPPRVVSIAPADIAPPIRPRPSLPTADQVDAWLEINRPVAAMRGWGWKAEDVLTAVEALMGEG